MKFVYSFNEDWYVMICWTSTWLIFLVLILIVVKFFVFFLLYGSFLHQTELKLTLMRLLGVSRSCYLLRYFPWEYVRVYFAFSAFLEVQTAMVVEFYGVIHANAMEKTQKTRLTNVWLILILITVEKSGLELLIFFVKGMRVLISLINLGFIHRESFYWYNKLPSSLFLEFFMNRYSLSMYCFC